MPLLPDGPKCGSKDVFEDNHLMIRPECAHEWDGASQIETA